MKALAVIGGTGFRDLPALHTEREHFPATRFGRPSGPIVEGRWHGVRVLFLHRHGGDAHIPPHRVNYRANIHALAELGAGAVVAVNAVGGIAAHCPAGALVVPDQLVDYTWGRAHTFDEGGAGGLSHIDFTVPYAPQLRAALLRSAERVGAPCEDGGVLAVTQGPRLETAAEIRRLARDGCDLVGMTGMPEAALAREAGLPYAALCMVVNAAAGLGDEPLTLDAMREVLLRETRAVAAILDQFCSDNPALANVDAFAL